MIKIHYLYFEFFLNTKSEFNSWPQLPKLWNTLKLRGLKISRIMLEKIILKTSDESCLPGKSQWIEVAPLSPPISRERWRAGGKIHLLMINDLINHAHQMKPPLKNYEDPWRTSGLVNIEDMGDNHMPGE